MLVSALIEAYRTDEATPYRKLRFFTRKHYDSLCKRIEHDLGAMDLTQIKARQLLLWHDQFVQQDKIAMGHSAIGMLRIISGFGATLLEDDQCVRLSLVLSKMRFKMSKPRAERLTAEQAVIIRGQAHAMNRRSIAIAQAFQFELMLRQKDVIGEWVPVGEPVASDVIDGNNKWLRGLRWEEIDENLVLRHVTSKRQKEIQVDLNNAPMVIQELMLTFGIVHRSKMPASGPIIVSDVSGLPWYPAEFRRTWRLLARRGGIPDNVWNMDTRSGAISEATDAGADLEHIRHASTHSDIGMVQRYSRNGMEKAAGVQQLRVASRKVA